MNRAKYKQRQDEYVRAIFESDEHIELQKSLIQKRSRTVARYWPRLRGELGDDWAREFEKHALLAASEFCDDALLDGVRFAEWISRRRQLGKDARAVLAHARRAKAFRQLSQFLLRK
jgi:hypothetical protein